MIATTKIVFSAIVLAVISSSSVLFAQTPVAMKHIPWQKLDSNPYWMQKHYGEERRVPKPFTPVKAATSEKTGLNIDCWGRSFAFGSSFLPVQMFTQGEALLAAPVRLSGFAEKKTLSVKIDSQSDDKVTLGATCRQDGTELTATTSVEFDGMLLCTLTFRPLKKNASIGPLALEIPLRTVQSTLMHRNFCTVSASAQSGSTPETWNGSFSPVMWLGNERVGLCFFAESSDNWKIKDTNYTYRLITKGDQRIFRVVFFDQPTALKDVLEIQFGWTPTPSRPLPANWLCWTENGWPNRKPYQTAIVKGNYGKQWEVLNEKVPWDQWKADRDRLHSQGYSHWLGAIQTGYFGYYDPNVPERKFWYDEWTNVPTRGVSICPRSNWINMVCAGFYERITKGGIEGMYFDCSNPVVCRNSEHGCNGGYTILAQREIRRRLANLFDEAGRESVIFEHVSDNMLGPVMNFTSCHYDGEQDSGGLTDYRKRYPLDRMRAFSIGTNWGHIPILMPYTRGNFAACDSMMAVWCIHMPLHNIFHGGSAPNYNPAQELDYSFDWNTETHRLGYWENTSVVSGQGDKVKVTLYYNKSNLFVVVSNLSDDLFIGQFQFNTDKIGFDAAKLQIKRFLDNQPEKPTLADGTLKATIRANSCQMYILE